MKDVPSASEPSDGAMRVVGLAMLLGILGCHLALRTTEFFPVDDAYISFRYAANFAHGDGLVFNPGERVEGYSNFLFVVLLAVGTVLGMTPPLTARLISIVSVAFLVGLMTSGRFAGPTEQDKMHAGFGWLAGLCLVLSEHTALNVLSGLEAPLTAGLLTAGVVCLGQDRRWLAIASFLLLALSRLEGIVLALLAAAWDLWRGRRQARSGLRSWLLLLVVPYVIFSGWRVVYYGSLLPNSVRAKSGADPALHLEQTLSYMAPAAVAYWPLILLGGLGLAVARRPVPREAWLMLIGVVGLCLLTGSGDPYRTLIRYLYPGLPLLLLIAIGSVWSLRSRAFAAGRHPVGAKPMARPGSAVLGTGAVLLLVFQLALMVYRTGAELMRKDTFHVIGGVGLREKIVSGAVQIFSQDHAPHTSKRLKVAVGQHDLARWLQDHASGDELLVSSQVGIAPYYTGIKVVDTFGLVTRHIADLPGAPGAKRDPDFVFDQNPDFFVFKKPQELVGGIAADVELFRDLRLRRHYDLVRMFNLGSPRLLLFQRRDSPVFDIHFDFVDQFSRQIVGRLDGESWFAGGEDPDRRLVTKHTRTQFFADRMKKKLRRSLEPVVRGTSADFEGADAMRRWLGQWRSWLEHHPGAEAAANTIRYHLRIPDHGFLRFGLGGPRDRREGSDCDRQDARAVRYSVLVRDVDRAAGAGRPVSVFSAIHDPENEPAHLRPRRFKVDLSNYARREVTLYFKADLLPADRAAGCHERAGWIEPILVRHFNPEGWWSVSEDDSSGAGSTPAVGAE